MLDGTNLFLIGMMGAGKTTVGKLLAQHLRYQFFDTDTLVENCTGKTVATIFAEDGESTFRQIEQEVLREISAYTRLVIATGGGIILNNLNWSHLRDGVIIWLDVPVTELYRRLSTDESRPLLKTPDPQATLTEIYNQRRDRYAQADIQVTVRESDSPEVICDRIMILLQERLEPNRLKHSPGEAL